MILICLRNYNYSTNFRLEPRKCLEKFHVYGLFCFDRFCLFFCILSFTVFCVVFLLHKVSVAVVDVPKCCLCLCHGWTWEFFICTNPLMRITMSFGVKEVFKGQERGWYDEINKSEKPKLGDSPHGSPQHTLRRLKHLSLGMPWASPSSSTKYQVISLKLYFNSVTS